ncbi:MAG: mannose-1-phosphate guanyltransferase [Gemmatimonadales bacterium]|nr:MAG: mannose-1-phosphate guanyltransferase [Gemmatimonadales bacterium]
MPPSKEPHNPPGDPAEALPPPLARPPNLHAVILAGGIGSRFWPASTPERPKQLLPLASPRPLIRDTVDRALGLVQEHRLHLLAGAHLTAPLAAALQEAGGAASFWVEPRARGTGPVLTWAAHRIARSDPDGVMISLHSDHFIDPEAAFHATVRRAVEVAQGEDLLLTVAIPPDRPETGYGYLRPGDPIPGDAGPSAWRVGSFVEKPDRDTAEAYLQRGYFWNSGIFVWSVRRFLAEVRLHAPEIATHLPLLDRGQDERFFERVTHISVDEAVLERSGRVAAVEARFRWDDVGTWDALARTRQGDGRGNVVEGRGSVVAGQGNVVWAEEGSVVLFGVDDLVVVRSGGITLVTRRDRAGELKRLLESLPPGLRDPS